MTSKLSFGKEAAAQPAEESPGSATGRPWFITNCHRGEPGGVPSQRHRPTTRVDVERMTTRHVNVTTQPRAGGSVQMALRGAFENLLTPTAKMIERRGEIRRQQEGACP